MMKFNSLVFRAMFLTMLTMTPTINAQNTTSGPCDLKCHFNTTCVPGNADFSQHPQPDGQPLDIHTKTISDNGWRCDCPEGKTGLLCGRTYIGCSNPEHKCYNGGKCIPGAGDRFGNTQDFCDCGDAIDEFGVHHVGKYCEIPAPVPCGDDNDSAFCVNGGHCKENWREESLRPCRCGSDYDGQHCEYNRGAVPNCTLDCLNEGLCKLGFKTYDKAVAEYQHFWEDSSNETLMHCVCKEGFFGPRCEVASTPCNGKHCFNNGACKAVKQADGSTKEHCECSSTYTGDVIFSGQYCQYASTTFCTEDKIEGGLASFCVNGGKCKNNDAGLDCICPEGFSGPICEFANTEITACTLKCENKGICTKGSKNYTYMNENGIDMSELSQLTSFPHTQEFESCKCPQGFVGLKCETMVETCNDGKHVCFHGSSCVRIGNEYSCDCNTAEGALVAGRYCQNEATSLCTLDGRVGTGKNKHAFCVNNGKCVKLVGENEEHAGCECVSGISGEHCEIRSGHNDEIIRAPSSHQSGGPAGMSGVAIFFITFASVIAPIILLIFYRRLQNQKEDIDFDDDGDFFQDSSSGEDAAIDSSAEKDIDDNGLENVEII